MKIDVKRSVNGPSSLILSLKDKVQVKFLSLDGDTLDAALELHEDETKSDGNTMAWLDIKKMMLFLNSKY